MEGQGSSAKGPGPLIYMTTDEDDVRLDCLAIATVFETYTLGMLQEFLSINVLGYDHSKALRCMGGNPSIPES